MNSENLNISTADELHYLLGKVYWIQSKYKQSIYWSAYVSADEKIRDLIFKLSHKAENHKLLLRELCSNIKDIDPVKAMDKMNFSINGFDPKDKKSEEIITKLADIEYIAFDIYSKILKYSDKNLIKEIWIKGDYNEYYNKLQGLINDENEVINLLKPYHSNLERIM